MIISSGKFEWNVPSDSFIMHPDPRNIFEDYGMVKTKVDAYYAIDNGLIIMGPMWHKIEPMRRMQCSCGGYLSIEGKTRFCGKCRTEFQYDKNSRQWSKLIEGSVIEFVESENNERGKFLKSINDLENKFKMKGTGAASVDQNRLRNSNKVAKDLVLNYERKMICKDGRIRMCKWKHVGDRVEIGEISETEDQKLNIGDDICTMEAGFGVYKGYNVLRLQKYNGLRATDSIFLKIEENEQKPVVEIKKDHVQNIKVKRKSHAKSSRPAPKVRIPPSLILGKAKDNVISMLRNVAYTFNEKRIVELMIKGYGNSTIASEIGTNEANIMKIVRELEARFVE